MNSQKCIWMECGYIEYKLCDRNFDCENCPFDKAMKQDQKVNPSTVEVKYDNSGNEKYFTINHLWLIKDKEAVLIGLDDFAKKFFNRNCTLYFPLLGSRVFKGKTLIWIIGSFGAIGIQSPLDGVVDWINDEVKDDVSDYFASKWIDTPLIRVEIENEKNAINLLSKKFLDSIEYENFLKKENQSVKEYLISKFNDYSKSATMHDGGEILKDYIDLLPKNEHYKLLKLLFNKKI